MDEIFDYVKEIQKAFDLDYQKNYPNLEVPKIEVSFGKKFARITRKDKVSKSVHCFVEISTGDIYKAATYNTPAKGVRGNVHNEKKPLYGYDYYR